MLPRSSEFISCLSKIQVPCFLESASVFLKKIVWYQNARQRRSLLGRFQIKKGIQFPFFCSALQKIDWGLKFGPLSTSLWSIIKKTVKHSTGSWVISVPNRCICGQKSCIQIEHLNSKTDSNWLKGTSLSIPNNASDLAHMTWTWPVTASSGHHQVQRRASRMTPKHERCLRISTK